MQNRFIIGVDEVGRGPLLGDVVISAVCLPNDILQADNLWQAETVSIVENHPLHMLTDSKKLSEKNRQKLFPIIQQIAIAENTVKISPKIIDTLNILQATLLGMRQAIANITQDIQQKYTNAQFFIVIDGNRLPKLDDLPNFADIQHLQAIVKGDSKHACISAASVLAKVIRDDDMYQLATQYPHYGIEKHKGYPTTLHLQAIEKYGILPEHRQSFSPIKKIMLSAHDRSKSG